MVVEASTTDDDDGTLEWFLKSGVLPMGICPSGLPDEELDEVIICDSISGGQDYHNQMPKTLTLARKFKDGRIIRKSYVQGGGDDRGY